MTMQYALEQRLTLPLHVGLYDLVRHPVGQRVVCFDQRLSNLFEEPFVMRLVRHYFRSLDVDHLNDIRQVLRMRASISRLVSLGQF
ncbi:hypothetical protein DF055_29690 [Burkholderia cepacia]|nr:hypothetical protein DF055_29690 [Burkholderia cepacia]